tara:strand:- start:81 stop:1121 length:1041 start_codon:yes stop_codon:yes gene_type:complete
MRAYEFLTEAPTRQQLKYMQRIYAKMQENPAVIDELWNVISTKIADDEGGMQSRIVTSLQPANTKPEEDQTYGTGFLEGLVDAIDKTEGTVEEKIAFATTLGQADHIDTKALLQPLSGWGDWLVGTPFSQRLFDTMFNFAPLKEDNKGPGEFALAILSPRITLKGSKGDITVDGTPVEVKAGMTSSGGRLSPTEGTLGILYNNKEFWESLFPEDKVKAAECAKERVNANNYSAFLEKYAMGPAESEKILSAIFKAPKLDAIISAAAKKGTGVTAADLIAIAVKNYGVSQGDEHFLILQKDIRTSLYFYVDDLSPIINRLSFSLPLMDPDKRSAAQAQLGILKKARN